MNLPSGTGKLLSFLGSLVVWSHHKVSLIMLPHLDGLGLGLPHLDGHVFVPGRFWTPDVMFCVINWCESFGS